MSDRAVRLPAWVAEVELAGERAGLRLVSGEPDCELYRFGREDASTALLEGYLYEPLELARRLGVPEARGARLLAAAWERWGSECLDRLDGSFVAAIWDAAERSLLVGHDAFGHHPLFYRWSDSRFWFSSNVLALAHCGRFPLRPDRLNLALNLRLARPRPGETYFEGVARLLPGHLLEVAATGGPRISRFWTPVPEPGEAELPPTVVTAELEERLIDSVARRMRLEPDGIMLSGGLDSVCIAALASAYQEERGGPPLVAYSARHHPDDPATYEEEMQDRVAARLGMPQSLSNEVDWLGGRGLIEASLDEVRRFPCPSTIFWKGGYMGFARWAAARGHHRFLTGSGGDEWLTVDPRYAADLLRTASFGRLASFVRADVSGTGSSAAQVLRYLLWTWGLRLLVGAAMQRLVPGALERRLERSVRAESRSTDCPDEDLRQRMLEISLERRHRALGLERPGRSFYRDCLRQAWHDSYMIHEREIAFHAFRSAGVIYTSPYHDRSLLDFLCRVPPYLLFRGSRYKGMIRAIASSRLPGLGLESQRKHYENRPVSAERSLREQLPPAWSRVGCRRLAAIDLIDERRARQEFDSRLVFGHDSRVRLYAMLSSEVWLEANFEGSQVGDPGATKERG